jgi:hypothetical protein
MKLSSIEVLGRRVSNDSLYEINTAGLASPISIPLDSTRIDLGAVGGGAGGGGGALIANGHAGGGGVWDYGSFTLAELYAGAGVVASNVTAVNAICTVGAGGAGGPGSLIGSGPDGSNVPGQGRNGTATTISIVATMSSGGTVTLKTLSGAGGRITLNPIFAPVRGFAVTGGNQDSFTLFGGGAESVVELGRDVIFGGQTWRGGRTSDVGSPALGAGKSPGGGGAGGGVPSLGGSRGADGGARVRVYGGLTREDRDHLPGQDSNDILPELVDPSTPVGIVRTINDDGETLYDGMTMAEIEALIERLVDERVAATVAAADAKAFEYTRQKIQEVLDAMNGPDATVDSVQDMFWLLNDLIEALMNATGVQPSS